MSFKLKTLDLSAGVIKNDPVPENPFIQKWVCKCVFIIFWVVFISYGSSSAGEFFDYHGMTGFYGQSDWTNIGPDPDEEYEWYNTSYFAGKDFKQWLSVETLQGPGYIKDADSGETGSLEWRLLLNIHSNYLFLKLGTGIAYLFRSGIISDLSNAHFFSIASCRMGFRFRLDERKKNSPEITMGYSVEHLSDPFKGGEDGDTGLNVGAITANISWNF